MPPRKRAASAPKSEPEQEELETPADEVAPKETPEAVGAEEAEPEEAPSPETPADPEPPEDDPADADLPCISCFSDGWPDGVTARGCEHGSWTRT
jgi:hypothetical protein